MSEQGSGHASPTRRKVLQYSAALAGTGVASAIAGTGVAAAAPEDDQGLPPGLMARIKRGERFRLRDLGIVIGVLPTGKYNAITDVPGVKVGYKTLIFDEPGVARTGVTVIVPRDDPMPKNWCHAGWFSHNGNGEMTGTHWIDETGMLTSLIGITHTTQVGVVRDALVKMAVEQYPDYAFLLPVVAETYDGGMNQTDGYWITEQDVRDAVADAKSGTPAEGNVGGGTGMHYFDFKGGSGTASRVVDYHGTKYTVGVFVQTNYGSGKREYLRVNGAPVGLEIPYSKVPRSGPPASHHSCIGIVATDAPMLPAQCKRLALRAGVGLADTGGIASNSSGDFYLAFSTGNNVRQDTGEDYHTSRCIDNSQIDPFFQAVDEAFQEAAHNSATMAKTMSGYRRTLYEIPLDQLIASVRKHKLYGSGFPA